MKNKKVGKPFKNVGDWADYNRFSCFLGYGESERLDIAEYIRENFFDPEDIVKEMKKGRVEDRNPEKLYHWTKCVE